MNIFYLTFELEFGFIVDDKEHWLNNSFFELSKEEIN